MYRRLLTFLRCSECRSNLELEPFGMGSTGANGDAEVDRGLLHCARDHWFPIVRGIPRMLPDSLDEHWADLERDLPVSASAPVEAMMRQKARGARYDKPTRQNFSFEWDQYQVGDKTWGMDLDHRVENFFLEPIRIPRSQLDGMVMLDAGCGNGSQSVAYTEYGVEVIAIDLSSGLEHGQAYRHVHPGGKPERVHFIQGDLQTPPIAHASVDLIHSVGALHHTPDTERTFHTLCPILRADAIFYVWLYSYERGVTPVVNGLRKITTHIPPNEFARVAQLMAVPFQGFCRLVNALGVRGYPPMERREAALALMDIFGAPYAHYHSFSEVAEWFREEGLNEVWTCNTSRRGFGACGRRTGGLPASEPV